MRRIFIHGILLAAVVVSHPPPALHGQVLPLRYYSVREGLISNAVRCITQDSSGYLWVGTTEGVSMFDGVAFRNISLLDGLPNSNINWIEESRTSPGAMWVATNGGGVCRIDGDSMSLIRLTGGEVSNRVNMVREDTSGRLWCATDGGVYTVTNGRAEAFRPDIDWREVVAIHPLGGDSSLIVSLKQVYICRRSSAEVTPVPVHLSATSIFTCARVLGDSAFWVAATGGGLYRIRGGNVEEVLQLGQQVHPTTIHIDSDGRLRVGAYDGVYLVEGDPRPGSAITRFTTDHGLQDKGITSIFSDREANLWFGAFTNGLSVQTSDNLLRFPLPTPIPVTNHTSLIVDREDHSWGVTSGGLIEIRRSVRGGWKTIVHPLRDAAPGVTPTGLLYDEDRHGLWVSFGDSRMGFYTIHPAGEDSSFIAAENSLEPGRDYPPGALYCFTVDARGRLYASIFRTGIVAVEPWIAGGDRRSATVGGNTVAGADIRALLVDRTGYLWAGGYISGVVKMRYGPGGWRAVQTYTAGHGLTDNSVRVLFEDRDGRIWIGTRYGGITILEGDSVRTLTVKEGLNSNAVWSIAQDSTGTMWLGTQAGLQSFRSGRAAEFSSVMDVAGTVIHACAVSRSGVVWARSHNGIVLFDAGHPTTPKPPPPIYITGLSVDGEKVPLTDGLELSYWQSNLSVDFTGISFADPEHVRYVYKLEDVDRDWQPPSGGRTISFAALKPGEYRLLLKAVNAWGRESAEPAVLRFSMTEPFWQRWWFILLCAAVLAGVSYGIHKNRIARFMAVEQVRSRIATDLHDDIGSDLTQIAILSEVVKASPGGADNAAMLDKIGSMARRAIAGMSDLVWYIDPRHDRLADLVNRIRDLASGLLAGQEIAFTVTPDPAVMDLVLSPEVRKGLLLTLKEALTNAVKHAECSWIRITLAMNGHRLSVILEDDGRGIGRPGVRDGHGLTNMQQRIESLGGLFVIGPGASAGTIITISVPVAGRSPGPT